MSPRLTRAESQQRTRSLVLDSAAEVFLQNGYHATSMEAVADRAGFSTGAIYSNFESKEALCMAALDRHYEARYEALRTALAAADATLDGRIAAIREWWEKVAQEEDWRLLAVEFGIHGRDNPQVTAGIARREQALRAMIQELLEAEADRLGLKLPIPAADLAVAFNSLGLGLALARLQEPEIRPGLVIDVLQAVLAPGTLG